MKKAKISNLNYNEWKYIFDNCIYYLNEDGGVTDKALRGSMERKLGKLSKADYTRLVKNGFLDEFVTWVYNDDLKDYIYYFKKDYDALKKNA
jgi:hypothetical protein